MNQSPEELRAKYLQNPPDGMTREDILHMNTDDLLDMDYLLNEDVFSGDSFDEEGFCIF